ncbi:MAG TPA: protein kinase [Myxococcales bacterium]|jgi:serine/threonine-protein kinase
MFGKSKPDDGSALTQPTPPGWRVVDLGLLGQGGMSRVHRVRDETLGREVALKVLRPELAKEDEIHALFVEEAKITAQLDHPNIPPVYAFSSEKRKSTCFTMKVLEGVTLGEMAERQRAKGVEGLLPLLEVLVRVCDAVAFSHSRGILHCDLKPGNVMVGEHGQIYVVDWGLARRIADLPSPEEDEQSFAGSPSYMAPEQARGQNHALDARTDVFLLGGILYRILTGRAPYAAANSDDALALTRRAAIAPPDAVAPGSGAPRRLVAICLRALEPEPAKRYQTVAELRADLEAFIHGTARLPQRTFAAGEAIVREGETGDCAYIILDGHCQATRVVAGKTQALRLLGPGEMFGETAVLTASPRSATVSALMDTTVAVVDQAFFQEEMERTSVVALAIRAVAGSFLDLNHQTAALLQERALAKTVQLALGELAFDGHLGSRGERWMPLGPVLERIARQSGLTPEAVREHLARQPGFEADVGADRLALRPPAK